MFDMSDWREDARKRRENEEEMALNPIANYRNELVDFHGDLGTANLLEYADMARVKGVAVLKATYNGMTDRIDDAMKANRAAMQRGAPAV